MLQVADIFLDRLGLPDWTFFGLLIVLLAGVPIVFLTAMVQSGGMSVRLRGMFNWKNTVMAGVAAVVLLALGVGVFMSAKALGIGPVGSLVAAGVLEREEAILIADFQSQTGDDLLAGAITEAFRIDFEQSPLVRVVAPGAVREGLLRMQLPPDSPLTPELAREFALREGLKAILIGEINRAGAGSIISVRLVTPDSEEAIVSFRETVTDSSGVIPAVDRLSNRMRERIGESLRSIRAGESLAQVSTASLLALRRYSQGVRAIDLDRDFPAGIALLEEAIAEDSAFAMAWRKLGVTLRNEGYDEERWKEALTRAFELSDRLTERERLLTRGSYFTAVALDDERAMSAYRTVLESYPNETTALNNLAVIHNRHGEPRLAVELLRRALAVDSARVIYYTNLAGQEQLLEEWEAADRTLAAMIERFPDLAAGHLLRARMLWTRGDRDGAEAGMISALEHPRATSREQMDALWNLGSLAMVRGRGEEGLRRIEEVVALQRRAGQSGGEGSLAQARATYRLAVVRDTVGAVQIVDDFLRGQPLPDEAAAEGAHLALADFFSRVGEIHRGREFLAASDRILSGRAVPPFIAPQRAHVEALLLFREGDFETALEQFRRALRASPDDTALMVSFAAAHQMTGAADSAVVHYEAYLAAPAAARIQNEAFILAGVLESLGELHEELGDRSAAAEYYLRFAELWAEADPELQPRVVRARERATALSGS